VKSVDLTGATRKKKFQSQELPEYALIIAAIAVAGCIAYTGFERGLSSIISNVTATMMKGA
jgi:hypothetical protein